MTRKTLTLFDPTLVRPALLEAFMRAIHPDDG